MSHQSRRHEYKHLLSRLCLIKREKFSGDDDLTRLCVPFEMDLHPAKRRRLDKDPGSWAKQTEDQIEEPHIQLPRSPFYQASSLILISRRSPRCRIPWLWSILVSQLDYV